MRLLPDNAVKDSSGTTAEYSAASGAACPRRTPGGV
jgi:hypothetical protein